MTSPANPKELLTPVLWPSMQTWNRYDWDENLFYYTCGLESVCQPQDVFSDQIDRLEKQLTNQSLVGGIMNGNIIFLHS